MARTPSGPREGDHASDVPEPAATFVRAVNDRNLDALLDTFADCALVNDQLREYWHKDAIAAWAANELLGQHLVLVPRRVVACQEQVALTATVDGDFDKRGLPDPLELSFYFSIRDARIVQLVILRNEPSE
jgi:SnoaL-like domain